MSDPAPGQADVPAELTTDARLGGLAREALVSDTGQARLGGLVREALISGVGVAPTIPPQTAVTVIT